MIRLRYKNDRNEMVSPLLHKHIVTGYSTTPDYLIINCKRTVETTKKAENHVWSLTILKEQILNNNEVMDFLKQNQYEDVPIGKDKQPKPPKQQSKKNNDHPKLF